MFGCNLLKINDIHSKKRIFYCAIAVQSIMLSLQDKTLTPHSEMWDYQGVLMLPARYIPNVITSLRIALVPYFVMLLFQGQFERALWLMVFLGLSDAVDGFLARCYDWKTTLGAYLDPIADKVMLISFFICFAILGWIPIWLAFVIVGRDCLLLFGALYYHWVTRRLEMQPLAVSKINTFAQIILAVSLVYAQVGTLNSQILDALMALVLCTTVASGFSYVLGWSRRAANLTNAKFD